MLKNGVTQTSHGDNSPNVLGNGNQVNVSSTVDKVLYEVAEQRKLTERAQAQEQTDRLMIMRCGRYPIARNGGRAERIPENYMKTV